MNSCQSPPLPAAARLARLFSAARCLAASARSAAVCGLRAAPCWAACAAPPRAAADDGGGLRPLWAASLRRSERFPALLRVARRAAAAGARLPRFDGDVGDGDDDDGDEVPAEPPPVRAASLLPTPPPPPPPPPPSPPPSRPRLAAVAPRVARPPPAGTVASGSSLPARTAIGVTRSCSRFASLSTTKRCSGVTSDSTVPAAPARPARPARWT